MPMTDLTLPAGALQRSTLNTPGRGTDGHRVALGGGCDNPATRAMAGPSCTNCPAGPSTSAASRRTARLPGLSNRATGACRVLPARSRSSAATHWCTR